MAQAIIPEPFVGEIVEVRIDYFHTNRRRVDMDNVAECILDALNGVAYADNQQVRLQATTPYSLGSPVRIYGGRIDIIKPLAQYNEYVFIRVRGYS